MSLTNASFTSISCESHGDGARLAAILSSPAAWVGLQAPDMVFANGATVELSWANTAVPSPALAVSSARSSGNARATSLVHRQGAVTTTSKL